MATVRPLSRQLQPTNRKLSDALTFQVRCLETEKSRDLSKVTGPEATGSGFEARYPGSKALRTINILLSRGAPLLLAPLRPASQAPSGRPRPAPRPSRRAPRTLTSGGPRSGCCGRTCRGPRPPSSVSVQTCPQTSPVARLTVSCPIRPAARRPRRHLKPSRRRRGQWRDRQAPCSPAHSPALTFSRNRPFDRRALRPPPQGPLGNAVLERGTCRQASANGLQGPA